MKQKNIINYRIHQKEIKLKEVGKRKGIDEIIFKKENFNNIKRVAVTLKVKVHKQQ